MAGSRILVSYEAQCVCQHGYMGTVRISLQKGSGPEVGDSGLVDIDHHVLKSTTSAGALHYVRDMRERRDSKFWSEIPKLELPTTNFRAARLCRQSRSSRNEF